MSATEAVKEIKYQIDLKDLPLAPKDVVMLGFDGLYPSFTLKELKYYNLLGLTKVAKLLGVDTNSKLSDEDIKKKDELRKKIVDFIEYEIETDKDPTTSSLYKPTKECGLILLKGLSLRNNQIGLKLYNCGKVVSEQLFEHGLPMMIDNKTEAVDIFRDLSSRSPIGNYIGDESRFFHFTGITLYRTIANENGKYYIYYFNGSLLTTREQYQQELAKQMTQLQQLSKDALQSMTQESIPLDSIIHKYLIPE